MSCLLGMDFKKHKVRTTVGIVVAWVVVGVGIGFFIYAALQ